MGPPSISVGADSAAAGRIVRHPRIGYADSTALVILKLGFHAL